LYRRGDDERICDRFGCLNSKSAAARNEQDLLTERRQNILGNVEGIVMFEVTENASDMIKKFLENQKGPNAVRILLQAG